jgi:hypothetical protein
LVDRGARAVTVVTVVRTVVRTVGDWEEVDKEEREAAGES